MLSTLWAWLYSLTFGQSPDNIGPLRWMQEYTLHSCSLNTLADYIELIISEHCSYRCPPTKREDWQWHSIFPQISCLLLNVSSPSSVSLRNILNSNCLTAKTTINVMIYLPKNESKNIFCNPFPSKLSKVYNILRPLKTWSLESHHFAFLTRLNK